MQRRLLLCIFFLLLALQGLAVLAVEPATTSPATDPKFLEKGYYSLTFVSGKKPKLVVGSPDNDKSINLAERNDIRISFDPTELYVNKYDKQAAVKVDLFEVVDTKRKYVSSQSLTLGRARGRVTMNMELGRFGKSSKDIELDIYDTERRLVNTYSATIKAEFLGAQSSIASVDLNSNPKANCTAGVFDDCYIEHILDRISFEARAQHQVSTRVLKTATGEYVVTVPVPRDGFQSLRESKFKAAVIGTNGGEITGGIDEVFTEVTSPIVNIGDNTADYTQLKYNDGKKQLDFFANGQTTSIANLTDTGRFGIGTVDPLAYLDLRGGTTTVPQARFRPGLLTSAPVSGAIEYDGGDFYFTTGNTRRSLSSLANNFTGTINASQITGILSAAQLPIKTVYTDTAQTLTNKTLIDTVVNGNFMVKNGSTLKITKNAVAGRVLTSDGTGVATWQALPAAIALNGTTLSVIGDGHPIFLNGSTITANGNLIVTGLINGNGGGLTHVNGTSIDGAVPLATLALNATTAGTVTSPTQAAITALPALLTAGTAIGTVSFANGVSIADGLAVTGSSSFAGPVTHNANIILGSNYLSGDGGNEGVFVDGSGRVGIDALPASFANAQFAVRGASSTFAEATGKSAITLLPGTTQNKIYSDYFSGGAEQTLSLGVFSHQSALNIEAVTGRVGIGIASPSQQLEVAGNVAATSFIGSGAGLTGITGANISDGTILDADLAAGINAAKITNGILPLAQLPTNIPASSIVGIGTNVTVVNNNTTIQGTTTYAPGSGAMTNTAGLAVTQTIMRVTGDGVSTITDLSSVDPQIAAGTADGQLLIIKCTASVGKKIKLYDGRGLDLAGTSFVTLDIGDTLTLIYDAIDHKWVEVSRSLN